MPRDRHGWRYWYRRFGILVALVLEKVGAPEMRSFRFWVRRLAGVMLALAGVPCGSYRIPPQNFHRAKLAELPMRSPLGAWGSAVGSVLIIVAMLENRPGNLA